MSEEGARIPAEIREEPAAIRETVAAAEGEARGIAVRLRDAGLRRLWVIGNGTSFHSSYYAAGLARRLAGPADPAVIAVTAGDFRTHRPALGVGDAVLGISASGEFRDVVGVFEELRGRIPTIGVVHVPDSTLTRISSEVVMSAGGPSFVPVMTKTFASTLAAAALVVAGVLGETQLRRVADLIRGAADDAEVAIAAAEPLVAPLADDLASAEHLFVVGGGLAHAAALEVALKLKEMALVHAEASETWEMATGPATMVGPGTIVVSLAPSGAGREATDEVVRKTAEWGARVIEVRAGRAVEGSALFPIPDTVDELAAPFVVVPPVALLAYRLARRRGATPDRPGWAERYHSQGLSHILGE